MNSTAEDSTRNNRNAISEQASEVSTDSPLKATDHDGSATDSDEAGSEAELLANPLEVAINQFFHSILDLRETLGYVAIAAQVTLKQFDRHGEVIEEWGALLESGDAVERSAATAKVFAAIERIERLNNSNVPSVMSEAIFLKLFSVFDAFSGNLLTAIFEKKPELYKKINKSVSVSDLLSFGNMDDIKKILLTMEIESFRRESYVDQFAYLESMFGIALTKYSDWSTFVEASQRRNIICHCDGIVSEQYLNVCRKHEYEIEADFSVGKKVQITPDYLKRAIKIVMKTGVMLGQVLWRKIFPDEIDEADTQLIDTIFNSLTTEAWEDAEHLSEFARGLPRFANERNRNIFTVNFAIARMRMEKNFESLLETMDLSSVRQEFVLAALVLRKDWPSAANTMKTLGKETDLINENAYQRWPLFGEFRNTDEFDDAYREVYGHSFKEILKKMSKKAEEKPNIAAEATIEIEIE